MNEGCCFSVVGVAAVWGWVVWSRRRLIGTSASVDELRGRPRDAEWLSSEVLGLVDERSTYALIARRAGELAVALEQATRLGGPDLIATYTQRGAGSQLYRTYLERMRSLGDGAALRLKVIGVSASGEDDDEPIVTTVLYLVAGQNSADRGRSIARESWFWVPVRGRCGACGAPQVGPAEECPYCGAEVLGPIRWVVQRIDEFEPRLG